MFPGWMILAALVQFLFVFLGAAGLIALWKRPVKGQVTREELDDLREEVGLMRDFLRDAMDRMRRIEEARAARELPAGGVEGDASPARGKVQEKVPEKGPEKGPGGAAG